MNGNIRRLTMAKPNNHRKKMAVKESMNVVRSSPYHEAVTLMNQILQSPKKSLKTLAYDSQQQLRIAPSTYAIVSKVCEHRHLLTRILQDVPIMAAKNTGLLYVLLFELLLSEKQSIVGGGALKRAVMEQESNLRKALIMHQKKNSVQNKTTTNASTSLLPKIRYIRVNTCRATTQQVYQKLQSLHIPIFSDPHVPDLFVMDRQHTFKILEQQQQRLFDNPMRDIILQDKSSCFSALCLASGMATFAPTKGRRDVLDACAAPGNKTSHLAALLSQESSIIYALDRDAERYRLLQKRMQDLIPPIMDDAGGKQQPRIIVKHQDFLETKPSDFPSICAILLDPSCSGSGIRNEPIDEQRIQELAKFQIAALSHAMKFPQVQYIVYSTCSIETLENEHVMGSCKNPDWNIVAPPALESWTRRGFSHPSLTMEESQCLIRVHPDEDDSNGFFVGCWQRSSNDNNNNNNSKSKLCATQQSQSWRMPRKTLAPIFTRDAWKKATANLPKPAIQKQGDKKRKAESPTNVISKQPKVDMPSHQTKKIIPPKAQDENDNRLVCKKRQKKIEWKRRQRDQKLARLQEKQKS